MFYIFFILFSIIYNSKIRILLKSKKMFSYDNKNLTKNSNELFHILKSDDYNINKIVYMINHDNI